MQILQFKPDLKFAAELLRLGTGQSSRYMVSKNRMWKALLLLITERVSFFTNISPMIFALMKLRVIEKKKKKNTQNPSPPPQIISETQDLVSTTLTKKQITLYFHHFYENHYLYKLCTKKQKSTLRRQWLTLLSQCKQYWSNINSQQGKPWEYLLLPCFLL